MAVAELLTHRGETVKPSFFSRLLLSAKKLEFGTPARFVKFETKLLAEGGNQVPVSILTDVEGHYSDHPQLADYLIKIGDEKASVVYRIDKYREKSNKMRLKNGQYYDGYIEPFQLVDVEETLKLVRGILGKAQNSEINPSPRSEGIS